MNKWFVSNKPNPSHPYEKVGPLVQDLETALKGTTSLLALKAGRSELHLAHLMSPAIYPELSLKWEAY